MKSGKKIHIGVRALLCLCSLLFLPPALEAQSELSAEPLDQARSLYRQGRYAEALKQMEPLLNNPGSEAKILAAQIHTQRREFVEARKLLEEWVLDEPDTAIRFAYADALYMAGMYKRAARQYGLCEENEFNAALAGYKQFLSVVLDEDWERADELLSGLTPETSDPGFYFKHAAYHLGRNESLKSVYFIQTARQNYHLSDIRIFARPLMELAWLLPEEIGL